MNVVRVNLGERGYAIHIGPGARQELAAWLKKHSPPQVAVIADQTVADLHLEHLKPYLTPGAVVLTFPPGEASKSLQAAERLYAKLALARVERSGVIVAFGGGVAGDLAGFVAATWLRGVRFIQVPTTLLAAVDASVGGKTGVNLPAGKNLVGAFHQPQAVIIDTEFLHTLSAVDYSAGLAESVKHAAIRDPGLLEWHEASAERIMARETEVVSELVARNCTIKAAVVAQDEREAGLRAILNYGHTIGHAIEHLLGYELRHGQCVALGMIAENELACVRGLLARPEAERIRALLARLGLPVRLPRPVRAENVAAACRLDKKVRDAAVNFVLLERIGQARRVADVSDGEMAAALGAIQPA
jgi:3-dehydroquinate synthase